MREKELLVIFGSERRIDTYKRLQNVIPYMTDSLYKVAATARGVRFGRPPATLPENFHQVYQQWKAGRITGLEAAKMCGMPMSTFRYRAEIYEKAKLL